MNQTEVINPMQDPRIEKTVVNISVGKSGEPLQRAMTILRQLTNQRPCQRKAKKTIREWGIRKTEPMACMVTLRGEKASSFLKRALNAVGNRIPQTNFDTNGNFSFGIMEHIEIPGVRYDPSLGIFGMDVCVTMGKPGYRVKKRRIRKAQVGKRHQLTPGEAVKYVKETFGAEII